MPHRCLNEDVKEALDVRVCSRENTVQSLGSDDQLLLILKECACVLEVAVLETFIGVLRVDVE